MNKVLKITFLCFLVSVSFVAKAQVRIGYQETEQDKKRQDKSLSPYLRYNSYRIGLRYGVAQTAGGMSTYIDQLASGQYALAGEMVLTEKFAFGAQIGVGSFKQRMPRQVYNFDGTDISAVQTRSLNRFALLATGTYHVAPVTATLRPYVQAGLGVSLIDYINYWGMLDDAKSTFTYTTQLAAGLQVLFSKEGHLGADLQVHYQYSPFTYDYITNVSTLGGSVGLFYRWW